MRLIKIPKKPGLVPFTVKTLNKWEDKAFRRIKKRAKKRKTYDKWCKYGIHKNVGFWSTAHFSSWICIKCGLYGNRVSSSW